MQVAPDSPTKAPAGAWWRDAWQGLPRRWRLYGVRVEVAAALVLLVAFYWILWLPFRLSVPPVLETLRATLTLRRIDPPTNDLLKIHLLRLVIGTAPAVVWLAKLPWHRWIWVPFLYFAFIIFIPISFSAPDDHHAWVRLIELSATGVFIVVVTPGFQRPKPHRPAGVKAAYWTWRLLVIPLRLWGAYLPWIVMAQVPHLHWRDAYTRAEVAARCAKNDGVRPVNLDTSQMAPVYYSVTPYDEHHFLLAGYVAGEGVLGSAERDPTHAGGSYWIDVQPDGMHLVPHRSRAHGNLWRGCVLDGYLWAMRQGSLIRARWTGGPDASNEEIRMIDMPDDDMDKLNLTCDAERHRLYYGTMNYGQVFEYTPATGVFRTYQDDGLYQLVAMRQDEKVVETDLSQLKVFDPDRWMIVDRVDAAVVSNGSATCAVDEAAVVTDITGRLREFQTDGAGHYRFSWGLNLAGPRKVAYSPDCRYIVTASTNDEDVFVIDRATRSVMRTFKLGPSIRDITFLGPREFLVADACTVTRLTF